MLFHLVCVEKDVLSENMGLARQNNGYLRSKNVKSFDFAGAIGSGKTELIAGLAALLKEKGVASSAIAGDVAGDDDARRLSAAGVKAESVNTGKECHLDAHLVKHSLERLAPENGVLFIENVGNLVCPADFPLGTDKRVVVVSVTEGEDMVRKHPVIFGLCDVAVVNKIDLAGTMGVNVQQLEDDFRGIRPNGVMVKTSAKTGEGVPELLAALGL
jgi:hydrogenase nickel incorporation protein HypB